MGTMLASTLLLVVFAIIAAMARFVDLRQVFGVK
jgi:hypothetical protein